MPLSEFLRMARGKLESGQLKTSLTDNSSRVDGDLVELVWENGQPMMQGQSSLTSHALQSNPPRIRDAGVGQPTVSRFGKFGELETSLNDISPVVPSGELDLSQDDEIDPWLNFPFDDALPHDYCSAVLPETSGVTSSMHHSPVPADKSYSYDHTVSNMRSDGVGLKGLSCKAHILSPWPPLQGQTSDPSLGSQFSDVISNSTSIYPDSVFGHSSQGRDLANDSASKKVEWPNLKLPNNNLLNFSHFSRPTYDGIPTAISLGMERVGGRDNVSVSSGPNLLKSALNEPLSSSQKGISFHVQPAVCVIGNSRPYMTEAPKESLPAENTEEFSQVSSVKNDNPADKATMLDEAIEYLKTLQLQVQIMSMGAGLCMPPVMFPPGIQHMHPAHVPHFSPMGMRMGMGFGTSMLDMNGGGTARCPIFSVPPMQAAQFSHPMSGPVNFPRIPGHNFPVYGFPSQGLHYSAPRVPSVPLNRSPADSAMGLSNSRIGKHNEVQSSSPNLNSEDPLTHNNSQIIGNAEASISSNHGSNQPQTTAEVLDKPSSGKDNEQEASASVAAIDFTKEAGSD